MERVTSNIQNALKPKIKEDIVLKLQHWLILNLPLAGIDIDQHSMLIKLYNNDDMMTHSSFPYMMHFMRGGIITQQILVDSIFSPTQLCQRCSSKFPGGRVEDFYPQTSQIFLDS